MPLVSLGTPTHSAPMGGAPFTGWDDPMDLPAPGQLRVNTNWEMLSPGPNYSSNGHAAGGQWSGTASPAAMFGDPTFAVSQSMSQAPMALPIRTNGEALGLFQNTMPSFQTLPTSQPAQEIKSHLGPAVMGTPLTPPSGPAGYGNLISPADPMDLTCPFCKSGPYKSRNDLK